MNFYTSGRHWFIESPYVGLTYGDLEQLTVIGVYRENQKVNLVVRCAICSQDPELYGEGLFYIYYNHLLNGRLPCGCSRNAKRELWQWNLIVKREATARGYTFHGWAEPFKGNATRCNLECKDHGLWSTSTVSNFLLAGKNCTQCGWGKTGNFQRVDDSTFTAAVMASGRYTDGSTFVRSERLTADGWRLYHHYYCPDCKVTTEVLSRSLLVGHKVCACSSRHMREAYVQILSEDGFDVALKFGVSAYTPARKFKSCMYTHTCAFVFKFPDKDSCLKAERDCKAELEVGVIDKRAMPDGFSETTWLYNLDKVLAIYRRNGGEHLVR